MTKCKGPGLADVKRRNEELERENSQLRLLAFAERERADKLRDYIHHQRAASGMVLDLFSLARQTCAAEELLGDDMPF